MGFFGKKKKEEEPAAEEGAEGEAKPAEAPQAAAPSGDASLGQLSADLEKLKAQFSSFYELQKAATERFSRINEQIGELRAMMLDREKSAQLLEAKATQAIDMVQSIQPDKFMVELRKMDFKIEALKANIESNENVIQNAVNEIKEMRNKINSFKGIDEVIKLNLEVKGELLEIKKIDATMGRHASKVETIYSEFQKRLREFNVLEDTVKSLDKSFKDIAADFDSIKVKVSDYVVKKELEDLISKMNNFEKHAGNILTLLNTRFATFEKEFGQKMDAKFDKTDKLLKGFEMLVQKTPDLNKYFQLLEGEANKGPKSVNVEKIKAPGEENPMPEKKPGILSKIPIPSFGKKEK